MARIDSIDKLVTSYFQVVTKEKFTYKHKTYLPKALLVSQTLLRGFTCPENCAGCCSKFSLDYIPSEKRPKRVQNRTIQFNGELIHLFSDDQDENDGRRCKHVNLENGRCEIHGKHPFSCDFELIRTSVFSNIDRPNILGQRLYGRGWNMLRVDDERGALCEMTPATSESVADVLRKLERLNQWAAHFKLRTWVPEIITLIKAGKLHRSSLQFGQSGKGLEL